jgi:hypothetical protein
MITLSGSDDISEIVNYHPFSKRLGPYVGDKEEEDAPRYQLICALADEMVLCFDFGVLSSVHYIVALLFWINVIALADMFGLCINLELCVIAIGST